MSINKKIKISIFLHIKANDDKIPEFRKENFIHFQILIHYMVNLFRDIENTFDFFESKKGEKWYKERNLPYQLTKLLHGIMVLVKVQ